MRLITLSFLTLSSGLPLSNMGLVLFSGGRHFGGAGCLYRSGYRRQLGLGRLLSVVHPHVPSLQKINV